MFDIDNWIEIFSVIRKNKLRTFLTGFSISWGIFMFCFLLCAGNGLKNGVTSNFESSAVNRLDLWGRRTSKPYQGFPDNRPIRLDEKDIRLIKNRLPETVSISGTVSVNAAINYKTNNASGEIEGINSEYQQINGIKILENQGRFINDMDLKENRKVVVVNERIKEGLFQNENPVGKRMIADSLSYLVIGVFEENSWGDSYKAYIPLTTAQLLYQKGWQVNNIAFTVDGLETQEENEAFEEDFRKKLADLHIFDLSDKRAVGIWNQLENYLQTIGIFNGISLFIWIIGIGTLLAGVISVSNIMLITVRERTREFGIRKALGAKPNTILGNILMESVAITSFFGYLGMFMGVGLGEVVNSSLKNADLGQMSYIFKNPTVEMNVAIGAMLVLIISGVVAGYYPALKAVRISPVEAMRDE